MSHVIIATLQPASPTLAANCWGSMCREAVHASSMASSSLLVVPVLGVSDSFDDAIRPLRRPGFLLRSTNATSMQHLL